MAQKHLRNGVQRILLERFKRDIAARLQHLSSV
jgi:hypothetical protein